MSKEAPTILDFINERSKEYINKIDHDNIQIHQKNKTEVNQMESKTQKVGTPPDFKSDGVAVWINLDKNGNKYLSIQLLGKNGIKVNAFKYEPKPKVTEEKVL